MNISIIIPTHNRAESLALAVRSARALDYPLDKYEVIVVDNASTDATPDVVQGLQRESCGCRLRYVREEQVGLHHARHAGVRLSKGDVLVFTDDDATFDPGWIQAYAEAFAAHPEMLAAGGPVRPAWEVSPPSWLLALRLTTVYLGRPIGIFTDKVLTPLSLMEPYDTFRLDSQGYFFGVNMAIRRSVFDWSGFHPELIGTRTIGNGESGLNQDIARRGGLIGYVPSAVVHHHIPVHRMTVKYIRRWAWHLGGSEMYQRWWREKRSARCLTREAIIIVREYRQHWLKDYFVRHRYDRAAIQVQFQASLGWCKLQYVWWMLTDPQVQAALDTTDFRP